MKRNVILSLIAAGLAVMSTANTKAWEVATSVPGTAISSVPFVISAPGNYYLASNLTFSAPAGAAITITASEVYLDLNGKTLKSTAGSSFNIGVLVFNQVDVTIQEGDIDGFGYAGVYLAPNSTDNNAKNVVDNVRFNGDGIGVLSVSGTSNWVKNCIIDGGAIGIYFSQDAGSRATNNIVQKVAASELFPTSVGLLSSGSLGTYFDNNLVYNTGGVGQLLSTVDKFRFETFTGTPVPSFLGGINQLDTSL
jgi:Right handed beta helix region